MDINLTEPQTSVFGDTTRFRVVCAGRRFGKSFLSGAELLNAAIGVDKKTNKPLSKQTVVYIAPTFAMAKQIMWVWLKEYAPKSYIKKTNESDMLMEFKNGSTIYLKSAEKLRFPSGFVFEFRRSRRGGRHRTRVLESSYKTSTI